jgi:hypothetical protein
MKTKALNYLICSLITCMSAAAFAQLDLNEFHRDSTDLQLEEMWKGTWVREKAVYVFGDIDTNYRSYQFFDDNVFKFNYHEFGICFSGMGQYFVKDSLLFIVTVWRDTSFISDVVRIETIDSLTTIDTRVTGGFVNRKTTYAKRVSDEHELPKPSQDYLREQNAGFAERRPTVFS